MITLTAIGPATIDDAIDLGLQWAQTAPAPREFDVETWRNSVRNWAIYFDHYARIVEDNLGQPRGFVMGAIRQLPWSTTRSAELHAIYVDAPLLETGTIQAILADFAEFAEPFGVSAVIIHQHEPWPAAMQEIIDELGFQSQRPAYARGTI